MAKVTIIGGHGKVALLAEPMLVSKGHTVQAVIRSEDQSADIEATGATPVVADVQSLSIEEQADLYRRLGTEVLVWSAGAGGGTPERTYAVDRDAAVRSMEAAKQAGIKRYIMVSYNGAGADHGIEPEHSFYPYAQAKAEADEHLRNSGLDFTILGPSALTLDPEGPISVGVATGDHQTSRASVARAIAVTVDDDSTVGKAIPFTDGATDIAAALASAPQSLVLQ